MAGRARPTFSTPGLNIFSGGGGRSDSNSSSFTQRKRQEQLQENWEVEQARKVENEMYQRGIAATAVNENARRWGIKNTMDSELNKLNMEKAQQSMDIARTVEDRAITKAGVQQDVTNFNLEQAYQKREEEKQAWADKQRRGTRDDKFLIEDRADAATDRTSKLADADQARKNAILLRQERKQKSDDDKVIFDAAVDDRNTERAVLGALGGATVADTTVDRMVDEERIMTTDEFNATEKKRTSDALEDYVAKFGTMPEQTILERPEVPVVPIRTQIQNRDELRNPIDLLTDVYDSTIGAATDYVTESYYGKDPKAKTTATPAKSEPKTGKNDPKYIAQKKLYDEEQAKINKYIKDVDNVYKSAGDTTPTKTLEKVKKNVPMNIEDYTKKVLGIFDDSVKNLNLNKQDKAIAQGMYRQSDDYRNLMDDQIKRITEHKDIQAALQAKKDKSTYDLVGEMAKIKEKAEANTKEANDKKEAEGRASLLKVNEQRLADGDIKQYEYEQNVKKILK